MGKSIHDNLDRNITYDECCRRYLNRAYESNKLHMICPKCCQNLQRVYSLYRDAEQLTEELRRTWLKTKRLHRVRHSNSTISIINENTSSSPLSTAATDDTTFVAAKEELEIDHIPSDVEASRDYSLVPISETVLVDTPFDLSSSRRFRNQVRLSGMLHNLNNNNLETTNESECKLHINLIDIYL